jgi:hypothetical protein
VFTAACVTGNAALLHIVTNDLRPDAHIVASDPCHLLEPVVHDDGHAAQRPGREGK